MGLRTLLALAVMAASLCLWGGQKTYIALRDGKQVEITCADYIKKRPTARWLKLTECRYDFVHIAYEEDASRYKAVYFPLRPIGEKNGPTYIVVKRDDRAVLDMMYAVSHGNENPPGLDAILVDLMKPTEGLVIQFGSELNDRDKAKLASLDLGVSNDFVFVDEGAKPNLAAGLIMLLLGLGSTGTLGWFAIASVRKPKAPSPPRRV